MDVPSVCTRLLYKHLSFATEQLWVGVFVCVTEGKVDETRLTTCSLTEVKTHSDIS